MKVDGVVPVYKPKGYTSFDVVKEIRRKIKVNKVGHTGTLDPIATGVLVICIGEATKLVPYLIDSDKEYTAVLRLGWSSDTQDITGNLKKAPFETKISEKTVKKVLEGFRGKFMQKPPMFSAKKVKGIPLYKIARQGGIVERKEVEIEIKKIELAGINIEKREIKFCVEVSKGTYIRTLCEDIGKKMGTSAIMSSLVRTKSSGYTLKECIKMKDFSKNDIIPLHETLKEYENIVVKNDSLIKVISGNRIVSGDLVSGRNLKTGTIVKIFSVKKNLAAIGIIVNRPDCYCRVKRVFN